MFTHKTLLSAVAAAAVLLAPVSTLAAYYGGSYGNSSRCYDYDSDGGCSNYSYVLGSGGYGYKPYNSRYYNGSRYNNDYYYNDYRYNNDYNDDYYYSNSYYNSRYYDSYYMPYSDYRTNSTGRYNCSVSQTGRNYNRHLSLSCDSMYRY